MPKNASAFADCRSCRSSGASAIGFDMISRALGQQMLLHVAREYGLNLAEYRMMTVLANRKSPSIKDIAAHTASRQGARHARAWPISPSAASSARSIDARDRRLRVVRAHRGAERGDRSLATVPFAIERQRRLERRLTRAGAARRCGRRMAVLLGRSRERMLAEDTARGGATRRRECRLAGRSTEVCRRRVPSASD